MEWLAPLPLGQELLFHRGTCHAALRVDNTRLLRDNQ